MLNIRNIKKAILYSDNVRSQLVKRNIIGMIFLKGISVITNFLLVPMTIHYLSPVEYGIWLTLSSVLMWVNVCDFGLGHGLRNKIAEAYATNDLVRIRAYTSTAFVVLSVLSICIFSFFYIFNHYIEWGKLLNIDETTGDKLSIIALWVMFFFCIQFVVRIIDVITAANQRPALGASINVVSNILILCIVGVLTRFCESSLLYIAIAFSATPVVVYLLCSSILFRTKYKKIRPSIKWINMKCVKDIVGLGGKFFIIQISAMLLFASSNVIISRIAGAEEVTVYNIAYKYFSIVTMTFTIITAPLWSAFTDAYIREDFSWIGFTIKKIHKLWLISIFVSFLLLLFANIFYSVWIGNEIKVPFRLSMGMTLYAIVFNFHSMYIYFINGVGKILIQLLHAIFSLIFFIPLSWYACNNLGSVGVILTSTMLLLPLTFSSYVQYNKVLSKKDIGIWSK